MGVGIIKALVFEDSNELKGENFQALPLVIIILFWFLTFASYVLNSISSSNRYSQCFLPQPELSCQ